MADSPPKLTWRDTEDIAAALQKQYPGADPLSLSFPKLHRMILSLENFGGQPNDSTEGILEEIQMLWHEG
ncbi:MAG: Fe-S cluster assembly protein IscX [Verrucomicrobiae bacterium]|nr:Fe-S cluster assembly protein IscX [Verrucomicrobiae bacterium]